MSKEKSAILKASVKLRKVLADPKSHRKALPVDDPLHTQSGYWDRFGVTQSGGSRYENGRDMDGPLKMLMALRELGTVSDADLADLKKVVEG